MAFVDDDKVAQLVRGALLASTALTAKVGNRVVGGFVRDTDLATLPKPSIAIVLSNGHAHYSASFASFALEVWALSALSEGEARALYALAFAALQGGQLAVTGVDHRGTCWESSRPIPGWHDATGSWTVMGRWVVQVANVGG